MPNAELRVWQCLKGRALGAKFRRQHPIGPYIADFACVEMSLIVEVDGASHFTADGSRWDERRTQFLEAAGWRIVRITNDDAQKNMDGVLMVIRTALHQ